MSISLAFTLDSDRYQLRAPRVEDMPHIFSASQHTGFNEGMAWDPPKHIDELEAPYQAHLQAWEEGKGYAFVIESKKTQDFLGRISIRQTKETSVWSVGFWTHPNFQNRGVMTEALAMVLDFGFATLEAEKIEAAYALWNQASEKVLLRNGFHFIKRIEEGFQKRGEWVAENLVSIDRKAWRFRQPA